MVQKTRVQWSRTPKSCTTSGAEHDGPMVSNPQILHHEWCRTQESNGLKPPNPSPLVVQKTRFQWSRTPKSCTARGAEHEGPMASNPYKSCTTSGAENEVPMVSNTQILHHSWCRKRRSNGLEPPNSAPLVVQKTRVQWSRYPQSCTTSGAENEGPMVSKTRKSCTTNSTENYGPMVSNPQILHH